MPEKIGLSISPGSQNRSTQPALTYTKALEILKNKNYPIEYENALIALLKKQPSSVYEHFLHNLDTHIIKIHKELKHGKDQA